MEHTPRRYYLLRYLYSDVEIRVTPEEAARIVEASTRGVQRFILRNNVLDLSGKWILIEDEKANREVAEMALTYRSESYRDRAKVDRLYLSSDASFQQLLDGVQARLSPQGGPDILPPPPASLRAA